MKKFFEFTITLSATAILAVSPFLMNIGFLSIQPSQAQPTSTKQTSIYRLPAPSGAYKEVTTAYYLVDSSRKETYSSEIYDLRTRQLIKSPLPTNHRELIFMFC